MAHSVPMRLMLNGEPFGKIATYNYATPWAEGKIEPEHHEHLSCLVAACEFLDWVESLDDSFSSEEEEERYLVELKNRGISQSDIDTITGGHWQIVKDDDQEHSIYWSQFDRKGFIHMALVRRVLAVIFILLLGACRLTPTPINTNPNLPKLIDLPQGWTKIEPAGDTRCAHNTPYAYWVRPGTTNHVFVYFQGGGGCYSAETCGLRGSYKDDVTGNDNPDYTIGGVFNLNHADNPFRDYTMVFVPYCTGDVHSGNRVETYRSNSGKTFDIYHRGYINASTAMNWIYANFEQPDSIFVTGCSAGSIGSILHTPHIIRHYPQTSVIQLGDSAGGLTSYIPWDIDADYDAGTYFPNWIPGMQEEIAHSFTISNFYAAVANSYPTYIFSQYNAANDSTQRRYFMADGGSEEDFATALQTSLNEIHKNSDNFRSYTAKGEHHCVLKHANFYSEETDGIRFRDWVANLADQIEVESVNYSQNESSH